jgi:hypothetical protein
LQPQLGGMQGSTSYGLDIRFCGSRCFSGSEVQNSPHQSKWDKSDKTHTTLDSKFFLRDPKFVEVRLGNSDIPAEQMVKLDVFRVDKRNCSYT